MTKRIASTIRITRALVELGALLVATYALGLRLEKESAWR